MNDRITTSITIIGGFLGAGKTTVLNHLLREADGRVAVLVNDFGALNIDAQLIEARDGEILALSNGCVCCSIGGDLSSSLAALMGRVPQPEHIFVEASGVADPWRIAQLAMLEPHVALQAVVVLADATCFAELLSDRWLTDTLARQIARADFIALSKCDIASQAALNASRVAVRQLRLDVPIAEISGGALAGILLGAAPAQPGRFLAEAPPAAFTTWLWDCPKPLDPARLHAALNALPPSVLRAKGFCRVGVEEAVHLLQRTGRRWALTPLPVTPPAMGIVLIGTEQMPNGAWLANFFAQTFISSG